MKFAPYLWLAGSLFSLLPIFAQSRYDPATVARQLFEKDRLELERRAKAAVEDTQTITADLDGDGRQDCILAYVMSPGVVGRRAIVYLNTGRGMRAAGMFPGLTYCWGINTIARGIISLDEYSCEPPYTEKMESPVRRYRWKNRTLIRLKASLSMPPASGHTPIRLDWATYLRGNFSFAKKWDYPPGVERMANGKPGCADGGFCPERCQRMLDKNGRIPRDSIRVFYSLLDTTHIHHSIQSTAWCYEWAGTDVVRAFTVKSVTGGPDTIRCESVMNEATHCSLRLDLVPPYGYPSILLNSITPGGMKQFFGKGGTIKLDQSRWKRGIIKASFDLTFTNTTEPGRPMFWRGKIIVPVERLTYKVR